MTLGEYLIQKGWDCPPGSNGLLWYKPGMGSGIRAYDAWRREVDAEMREIEAMQARIAARQRGAKLERTRELAARVLARSLA